MPTRAPSKQSAPAEVLSGLSMGYNGYTDPTLTNPKMWAQATNVFSGAFSYIERCRFANVIQQAPATGLPYTSLKFFSLPGMGAYLMADQNGKLFSYDTLNPATAAARGITLLDSTGTAWLIQLLDTGILQTTAGNVSAATSVFVNDSAVANQSYQMTVNTSGQIVLTSIFFSGLYPSSLLMMSVGGLFANLTVQNGAIQTGTPISRTAYALTQRLNPYIDPTGVGNPALNGPWSREALQGILYEMNGTAKQAGRGANAATIEGFGLDAPDSTPQITVASGSSVALTNIQRQNGIVTAHFASLPAVVSVGAVVLNIINVSDATFNGSFLMTITGSGPFTSTWSQAGQNATLISGSGNITSQISKVLGRSYAYAWENANKNHVGAPSPVTQYIVYANQNGTIQLQEQGTVTCAGTTTVTGTGTAFTNAWLGRVLWVGNSNQGRIVSVQSPTQLTLATPLSNFAPTQLPFAIYDPQATHVRLYATADGQATYLRIARNAWNPAGATFAAAGLVFFDAATAEPPNFPFTTETVQVNNVPPPIGQFLNEYQGTLIVYGVPGAGQSFFYSNQSATTIGLLQESFAPLNQVTMPLGNGQLNGMIEFPGSLIIWSDKQDMFRMTGLLTDNTVTGVAQGTAAAQQGATIARLPYNLGCATPFAADITPLGGVWLTSNAEIWLYTDRYAPRNIGRPVQDILSSISPGNLTLARAKYFHTATRNWFVLAIPANGKNYNNTLLVLDLDLLASNGSPSYFTFDMATNSPAWWVFQPGTTINGNWVNRCDSIESVYEVGGMIRLMVGQVDLIQDVDYQSGGAGTEISVPNGSVTTHAHGNDTPFMIKRPTWLRFNTNRDPSMLNFDGWTFQALGIDDDFYTFEQPLALELAPGLNDSSTLGGNPDFFTGLAYRHSPELFRVGGVNFVAGRRLRFQINFPSAPGTHYQLRSVQLGYGVEPPN